MTVGDSNQRPKRTGARHLERLSVLRKRIQDEQVAPTILLVENERLDVHFVETPLRRLFGAAARIDVAISVATLKTAVESASYDVILLDDRMDGDATAEDTLRVIRKHQREVKVVVFSRILTNKRRAELQRLNCHSVHGKEDLDSAVLGEAILTALGHTL